MRSWRHRVRDTHRAGNTAGRTTGGARQQVARADLGQELGVEAARLNRQMVQLSNRGEAPSRPDTDFRVSGLHVTGWRLRRCRGQVSHQYTGSTAGACVQARALFRQGCARVCKARLPLLVRLGQDVLLDGGLRDQAVDVHGARLPDAVAPVLRLQQRWTRRGFQHQFTHAARFRKLTFIVTTSRRRHMALCNFDQVSAARLEVQGLNGRLAKGHPRQGRGDMPARPWRGSSRSRRR